MVLAEANRNLKNDRNKNVNPDFHYDGHHLKNEYAELHMCCF